MTITNPRQPDHAIDPLFIERWSPRVFTGEVVPEPELLRMFEAARWAPSSYNSQPWRFVYALRGTPDWDPFLNLLVPGNRKWAGGCGALVILVSSKLMETGEGLKLSESHSLDTGAASANFQLQAIRQGWHVHGMGGFDKERAATLLDVPANHQVEAAYGVGRAANPLHLGEEQRAREVPNNRRPIADFAFSGRFKA